MFKIAKNINTNNEKIDVKTITAKIGKYENGNTIYDTEEELEISISGNIENDEYCLRFIIKKPIDKYFEIEKYNKEKIDINEIIDNYITINGTAYLEPLIELEVLRFNEKFIFSLIFRDSDNEFFGSAEFEVNIEQI